MINYLNICYFNNCNINTNNFASHNLITNIVFRLDLNVCIKLCKTMNITWKEWSSDSQHLQHIYNLLQNILYRNFDILVKTIHIHAIKGNPLNDVALPCTNEEVVKWRNNHEITMLLCDVINGYLITSMGRMVFGRTLRFLVSAHILQICNCQKVHFNYINYRYN